MENIIRELIDSDVVTREVLITLAARQSLLDGTIEDEEEEGMHIMFWMTRFDLLDDIRDRIEGDGFLSEYQKSFLWDIVVEGACIE